MNGHLLEGDNLGFRSNGFALCRACALASTQKYQRENRDQHLEDKSASRLKRYEYACEQVKPQLIEIFAILDDDEMIANLANFMRGVKLE